MAMILGHSVWFSVLFSILNNILPKRLIALLFVSGASGPPYHVTS